MSPLPHTVRPLVSKLLTCFWQVSQVDHVPVILRYDFIGHQETLQEDVEHLLNILKVPSNIQIPSSYHNLTFTDSVESFFQTVPLKDRIKLYKLYESDFKVFGYRMPDELLKEWEETKSFFFILFEQCSYQVTNCVCQIFKIIVFIDTEYASCAFANLNIGYSLGGSRCL